MSVVSRDRKVFDQPFAYILMNYKANAFCSYCLQKPDGQAKLSLCGSCEFARYCNKECQKAAWKSHHKPECAKLKKSFPNLPLSEVLFLSRITERLNYIKKNGDTHSWQRDRKFADLMTHVEEIKTDTAKMDHFEKIFEKTSTFFGPEMPEKQVFFEIFCRTWINSHSIHTSAGRPGVSYYNHSCRPNCSLVFDGFKAVLRPLVPGVRVDDPNSAFIAYVDVGRSKKMRRDELKVKWYFPCECERCRDPVDDRMTAIKCPTPGCNEALVTTEEAEPVYIACPKCKQTVAPEHVAKCQQLMKSLPARYEFTTEEKEIDELRSKLTEATELLHQENIYLNRMMTAYLQMRPSDKEFDNPDIHKQVYTNFKRCFPETDRHRGYQLLHLVKSLIELGQRDDAVEYAFEAMQIFEVCFGLDHPYYLQTLALWTFLKDKRDKSNEELVALMNFNYNRPVDISSVLQMLPTRPNITTEE